jgi:hypothetical protein
MILIAGNDPLVDHLCLAFESLGRPHRRVAELDAGFAWELHATALILVESLPRLATAAAASERALPHAATASECGPREIISAANAPGVRSAIIVTPRPDADAELRAVRRSGIPYTILRPLAVVDRVRDPAAPILVTRELAIAKATAVSADMVLDALVGALDGGACGHSIDIAPPPDMTWAELLARVGVTPKPVAAWRARLGRWFGVRTFDAPNTSLAPASP